jgi:hypothetical protein
MRILAILLAAMAVVLCAVTKLTLSRDVHDTANVMEWYPLQVGNRWIYKHEVKYGNETKPTVEQWTREVSVTGHVRLPEGLLVLRSAKVTAGSSSAPTNQPHPYLIRGQYIYRAFYDPEKKALKPESKRIILGGTDIPEFFFPLEVGLVWAEKNREDGDAERAKSGTPIQTLAHWLVTGRGPHGTMTPGHMPPEAYSLYYETIQTPLERWFQKGVGILGEASLSHGNSYLETRMMLQKFIPASGKGK